MSYREDLFRTWVDLERLEQQMRPATHFVLQQFDKSTCHVAEKMRRVVCVRKALDDSVTLARSMVAKALMGVEISTVWDILIGVCRDIALYYGGSVLTGSVIGGVGGAFFGGVGAVPGTIAGASSGAAIGGWILGLLGLRALVQDLVGTLPRALQYYQQGIQEAWGSSENRSCSGPAEWNHGSLSQATFLLANGHVQMVIALLSALMLWISRGRGERANALQSINQSARLGPKFAKWIEVNEEKLHTLLASRSRQGGGGAGRVAESAKAARSAGKTAAKGVDEVGATRGIKSPGDGVEVKPAKFVKTIKPMSREDMAKWLKEKHGITNEDKLDDMLNSTDFTKPVNLVELKPGTQVVQYVRADGSVGTFFAYPGTSPSALAITGEGRVLTKFTITEPVQAIECTAASFPTGKYLGIGGPGGGTQLIFPKGGQSSALPN